MDVSKESISKFLIGNRFHVKLRNLCPENCNDAQINIQNMILLHVK